MDQKTTDRSTFAKGLLLAIPTLVIWGVTYVNTKALLDDFSAFEILFLRFLMAYGVLWCLKPQRLVVDGWREEAAYAGMGLAGVTVYQFLENCALHWTNASNVCILVSVCPMTTAILSQVILGERVLTLRFIAGFVMAMTGITLVCLNGVYVLSFHPVGDMLAIAAALSWSFYSVIVTKVNARGRDPILTTRRMFFWALVAMLPLLGISMMPGGDKFADGIFAINFSASANAARLTRPVNLMNLGFLGVLASALCFTGVERRMRAPRYGARNDRHLHAACDYDSLCLVLPRRTAYSHRRSRRRTHSCRRHFVGATSVMEESILDQPSI